MLKVEEKHRQKYCKKLFNLLEKCTQVKKVKNCRTYDNLLKKCLTRKKILVHSGPN